MQKSSNEEATANHARSDLSRSLISLFRYAGQGSPHARHHIRSLRDDGASLAWLFAVSPDPRLRDVKKALDLATKACELTKWSNPGFLDTLAAAYAEAGDFAEAIRWAEKTLAMTPSADPAISGMRDRLALYQKNTAYHDDR